MPALFFILLSIPLIGDALYPESIALDARDGALYVGSNRDGSVQRVKSGVAHAYQAAGRDGREEALGVKVDDARDRLWVVSPSAVYVYKMKSDQLLAKVELASIIQVPNPGLNDLVIDGEGNAYVAESFHPLLLKIDGRDFRATKFRDLSAIPYGTQGDFKYNLNGIILARDGKSLIAVKTNEGTLWRIRLDSDAVTPIALTEPLTKGDGLVWGERDVLYAIRNFENKISKVDFSKGSDDQARAVTSWTSPELAVPTSAAYVAGKLIVVNSQFGKSPAALPFRLSVFDTVKK